MPLAGSGKKQLFLSSPGLFSLIMPAAKETISFNQGLTRGREISSSRFLCPSFSCRNETLNLRSLKDWVLSVTSESTFPNHACNYHVNGILYIKDHNEKKYTSWTLCEEEVSKKIYKDKKGRQNQEQQGKF